MLFFKKFLKRKNNLPAFNVRSVIEIVIKISCYSKHITSFLGLYRSSSCSPSRCEESGSRSHIRRWFSARFLPNGPTKARVFSGIAYQLIAS